jgi:hypothetical protein
MNYYYLADIVSDNMVTTNLAVAKAVATQWDKNWETFFTGPIFSAIVTPCAAIAFVFFAISTVLTVFQWAQDQNDKHFVKLLSPLLIFILLVGKGNMLAGGIQGIRAISNSLDNTFLQKLNFDQNVNNKQQNLVGQQEVLQAIKKQGDICKQSTGNPTGDTACLAKLDATIKKAQDGGKVTDNAIVASLQSIRDGFVPVITGNATQAQNNGAIDLVSLVTNPVGALADRFMLGGLEVIVFGLLNYVTGAVQAIAEASMLLTALISPLFVAAALLPNGTKSMIALFTAFWSIMNYKFCYIIVVGLSAQVMIDDNSSNGIMLGIITAFFAPLMAGILAGGAGMGFAKAAASVAGQTVGAAANIAVKVATGGIAP